MSVVLPASFLAGGAVVALADLVARTVVAPVELPLGVVTALVGGPLFLWLILRTRQSHGGWAGEASSWSLTTSTSRPPTRTGSA